MKVFKFGGASVKDANAVKNVAAILQSYAEEKLVVVISAMGKTTNAFEALLKAYFLGDADPNEKLQEIKDFHLGIINGLFEDPNHPIFKEIHNTFVEVEWQLEDEAVGTYAFEYDQMVSIGEMLSTKIISAYLQKVKLNNKWLDVRDVIRTDNNYRNANVDWEQTESLCKRIIERNFENNKDIIITQGFVGASSENFSTTLGREGSDYTAAIIASSLLADEVVIWKDVDGMLNADPKYFDKTIKLNNISYLEAVELAYYGASVIHPKTIKPLQNANIPLLVKSFLHPNNKGSLINNNTSSDSLIPSYIHKPEQILISLSAKDYSFIAEGNLSDIFQLCSNEGVQINCMQNSAISFSFCVDYDEVKVEGLIEKLKEKYKLVYNDKLELLTIRHFSEEIVEELLKNRKVFLEQRTRHTARFVVNQLAAEQP